MQGAEIHAPDINKSGYLTDIHGRDIYMGFIHLQNLREDTAFAIVEERNRNGDFTSLEEFMRRVSIELEQLRILVRIGAFRFTGRGKKQLLWDLHLHLEPGERRTEMHPVLFAEPEPEWKLPELSHTAHEDANDEIELLGFALSSPFARMGTDGLNVPTAADNSVPEHVEGPSLDPDIPDRYRRGCLSKATDFPAHIKKNIVILGYLVTTKPTRTVKGERMAFGTWLDEEGFFFDTTHFPGILQKYPFRGRGIYRIEGKADEEFGFCSLTVTAMEKVPMVG
jgi:DNA polymerase III alpha subunit